VLLAYRRRQTVAEITQQSFVVPARVLQPGAPARWMRLGWADLRLAPRQSLGWGAVTALLSLAISAIAWRWGSFWLLLAMLSGFVFIAPMLAIAPYSISAQLARGQRPSLRRCIADQLRLRGTAMVFALVLLVIFLVWARAASMISVFFPFEGDPAWRELLPYLAIGSAVGSIFALLCFSVSAFSLPLMHQYDVDAITAVVSSFNAVLRNKRAMVVWVGIIVAAVLLGAATGFLGFVVIMPLLGHATWHACRETLDASGWPDRPA
jgi:uncharacterized membrane protein